MERFLVTAALPYANGPLHVGHMAGAYLPADIFVRYLRLRNRDVVFICGSDEHGVPITLAAEQCGKKPADYVKPIHDQMDETFKKAGIHFDNFSGTARPPHYALSSEFFLSLNEKGYLAKKPVKQLYCEHDKRYLPDRYVEGVCPKCQKAGARGDQCESCGSDLDQTELLEPRCKICNNTPVLKDSFHWFLRLSAFEGRLREWLESKKGFWKDNVVNFVTGLLNEGLPDRAITRDMDWGVPVPLEEGAGKVIYVWFDAPIGYISSTMEWALETKKEPELWKKYWLDKETRLIHFIGKDNIVFHSIMWPAVLMGDDRFVLPYHIPANEFLNLEGKKVSTSRNYAIWIHEFLEDFPADTLRFYLASIAPEAKDSDFVLKEFQALVNGELADVLGNFVNRTVTFVERYFEGKVPALSTADSESSHMLSRILETRKEMETALETYQVRKAVTLFMGLSRDSNKYFNDRAPWKSRKENLAHCGDTLHVCLTLIRALGILASPILPFTAEKIVSVLAESVATWDSLETPLIPGSVVRNPGILFTKIEDESLEKYSKMLS